MPAAITDKFSKVISGTTRPVATTLAAQKLSGANSATVVASTGWDTGTAVHGIMYRTDAGTGAKVAGSQIDWKGVISGTTISDFTVTAGTDDTYAIGTTVELSPTAAWGDDMATGILVEHNQDGTHAAVTADSLTVDGATTHNGATTLVGALTVKSYDGWINTADTWTYASATTFTIAGVDRTAQFPVGTKIKLTQTSVKYFYVTAAAFATDTTITVTGGSDYSLANAAITAPALSYDTTPQGFPGYFNWTPSWTNLTVGNATTVARLKMIGKELIGEVNIILGNTSSIAASAVTLGFPVTPASRYGSMKFQPLGTAIYTDEGSDSYGGFVLVDRSTTTLRLHASTANATYSDTNAVLSTAPFTWAPASADAIAFTFKYEVA